MARDDRDARGGHKQPDWKFDPCGCYWCERGYGKREPYNRTREERTWRSLAETGNE